MNSFISLIKNVFKKHNTYDFYKSLRKSLDTSDPPLSNLFDDLDDHYCEAGKLLGKNLFLGCIYMFNYNLKIPSEYKIVKFIDPTPMVLITAQNTDYIRGINLNLCSKELRTLILNIVTNLDENFYNGQFVEMCIQKKKPLSNNVLKFMADDGEKQIVNALKRHFDKVDYGAIFRTYKKEKIKQIKMIEYYIWPYIPLLEFNGIPANIMELYWNLSGINQIKM